VSRARFARVGFGLGGMKSLLRYRALWTRWIEVLIIDDRWRQDLHIVFEGSKPSPDRLAPNTSYEVTPALALDCRCLPDRQQKLWAAC
jgi:hypothetical protein